MSFEDHANLQVIKWMRSLEKEVETLNVVERQ